MSQDLATISTQLPAYLRGEDTGASNKFAGGIGQAFPLAFLSVRGKEFRFRKGQQEVNTRQRELEVILVDARSTLSRRFFKDKYSAGSAEGPTCSSKDSVTPDVANPIAPTCAACPNAKWGSRITENGKEGKLCQDYKRLVVLPVGTGISEPVVLDIAATSLKAPKGQKGADLMLGDYLSLLTKHGLDPTKVVTKLAFTDAEYPQLCFGFARFPSEQEYLWFKEAAESEDVKTVIEDDLHEAPAGEKIPVQDTTESDAERAIREAQAAQAAAPKPEPEPEKPSVPPFTGTTVLKLEENGDMALAEDEATYLSLYAKGYRPVKLGGAKVEEPANASQDAPAQEKTSAPSPEPQTAPDAPAGGSGNALLDQVAALLAGKKQ